MGVLKTLGLAWAALVWFVRGLLKSVAAFFMIIWNFAVGYIRYVNDYTAPPMESDSRPWKQYAIVRYTVRGFLYTLSLVIVPILPVGIAATFASVLVAIDQATYPTFEVDQRFLEIALSADGKRAKLEDVGATLMSASYLQMEKELNSTLGWTPNDILGLQAIDNRLNRQLGVRHASIELLQVLSIAISKLGSADEESPLLVKARQGGFVIAPGQWLFPEPSESVYYRAIELIKEYQRNLRANIGNATINITNKDIETILRVIADDVLRVPRGMLNARTFEVSWFEIDDRVFFAQGAAIVARDVLVAIKYAFEKKITDTGAMDNLDRAIASLEGVLKFHPWWIIAGDADSLWADHRSKLARYYTDAIERTIDVAEAVQR